MITQSQLKEQLHYNPETGVFTRLKSPNNGCSVGDIAGSVKKSGRTSYSMISVLGFRRPAHQFAWVYMTGTINDLVIDHIDGNGLNNKWYNLRNVTTSENSKNQRLRISNTSGFMGVTWRKDNGKWRVRINHKGKRIQIGEFVNLSDAVLARIKIEAKYNYDPTHGAKL